MRVVLILGGISLLAMGCSGPGKTGAGSGDGSAASNSNERRELTVKEIVERHKPAVVRVESDRGVGTGFVVDKNGRVATNLHVIAGASAITVEFSDKRKLSVDMIVAIDAPRDLAVLHVNATDLQPVPLGDSDKAAAGDPIVIIGNPLGVLDFTVSDGLVSSLRKNNGTKVIQTSAPISQGSSGGPLFNNYGEVIGIATFFATEGQNLNFAIPSNYLLPLVSAEGGETVEKFAERFKQEPQKGTPRSIPIHKLSVLDGCTVEHLALVEKSISDAIDVGAPVYNRGEHQACFVIYRSAGEALVKDPSTCQGVREAFKAGLARSEKEPNFTRKAWAMRDTFDGLLIVIAKKARGL